MSATWPAVFLGFAFLALPASRAAEWRVAPQGTPQGRGTSASPWDIASALGGDQPVAPGDTLWLHGGTYRRPFENLGMGWPVRLAGREGAPIHVRAWPGQRTTVDGGLNLQPPATQLWIWDLEILVSEPRPDGPVPPDPTYRNLNRPWGGLNVYAGEQCKFINLVIHDNAQGVSWWAGSTDSELHGCIVYDNGWPGTDRGHGHAVYTQNRDGTKTIADCLFTGGYGYTLHAYGSSRAFVDNYHVEGNMAWAGNTFLIGGGQPSRGIRVLTNLFHGVPVQLGYDAPTNVDCEVRGNILVNAGLKIQRFHQVRQEGNLLLGGKEPRPEGYDVVLRPNRYDTNRAHLAIFNWQRASEVEVDVAAFLRPRDRYRLQDPRDFYGQAVLSGTTSDGLLRVPMQGEFAAFVLLRR